MSRFATPKKIGEAIGGLISSAKVEQITHTTFLLSEQDDPFCEVTLLEDGTRIDLSFSVHCAPGWAAAVTATMASLVSQMVVSPIPFLLNENGVMLRGYEAEAHWYHVRRLEPLLTARFTAQPPYLI